MAMGIPVSDSTILTRLSATEVSRAVAPAVIGNKTVNILKPKATESGYALYLNFIQN